MKNIFDEKILWLLHYDGDDDGDDGDGDDDGGDNNVKTFTEEEVNRIVQKRTDKVRASQKKTLAKLEEMQKSLKMTSEERESLQAEIEELQKQTMSNEEIAKREQKRAQDRYEKELTGAKEEAGHWQTKYNDLKINYEITSSATEHGVLNSGIPFLEAYLRPSTKLVEQKDEEGQSTGKYITQVTFQDDDGDGNPVEVQMSIPEVVKRMKDLPDKFGHLFAADAKGGTGTNNGQSHRGPKKDIRNLSQEEYNKLRKEDPEAIYGS